MNNKRYVFNNTEIKLTGRTAEKKLRRRTDILHEIVPADGSDMWREWVRLTDLYEIKKDDEETNNN